MMIPFTSQGLFSAPEQGAELLTSSLLVNSVQYSVPYGRYQTSQQQNIKSLPSK